MRDKYIQNFCVILEVNLGMLEEALFLHHVYTSMYM